MRATVAAVLVVALAACNPNLEGAKCSDDTNCPSGQRCGFDATCREGTVRYGVSLDPLPQGTVVGPAGKTMTGKVTRASTTIPDAPSLALLVNGVSAATCSETSQSGATSFYQCIYAPAGGIDGPVRLSLLAAGGTADASQGGDMDVLVDTAGPVVAATLTCGTTPCLRDGTLTISATVADSHPGTGSPSASLAPAAGGAAIASVTLTGSGGTYSGTLDLKSVSFPFYAQDLAATVTAADALTNVGSGKSSSLNVTRLRWSVPVTSVNPPVLTGAVVDTAAGRAYFGGGDGNVYLFDSASGAASLFSSPTVSPISAAPSLGASTLWVGANDKNVYARNKADGSPANGTGGCPTGGPVQVTPAILTSGSEYAIVGSTGVSGSSIYAMPSTSCPASAGASYTAAFGGASAIDQSGNIYAVAGQSLYSYILGGPPFPQNWSLSVGAGSVAVAIDKGHLPLPLIWTAATSGTLDATTHNAANDTASNAASANVGAGPAAPVVDAGANVVVGNSAGELRKVASTGTVLWTTTLSASVVIGSALVLTANGTDDYYLVPTAAGTLFAVDKDGNVLWSGTLTAGSKALSEGNVVGKSTDSFTTAVFGGADGTVYGVIVDGHLDKSAPWPKANHDPANTGNAATALP